MPISPATTYKSPLISDRALTLRAKQSQSGFTIFEIMIAMFLIGILVISIPQMVISDRELLEKSIDDIDRAIRFATNESVLLNKIVRLRFEYEENKVEYFVEFTNDANFVLLDSNEDNKLNITDEEEIAKKQEQLNKKFQKLSEFEDRKRYIEDGVYFVGIANANQKNLQARTAGSIYFYPTGDRDAALILFGTQEEVAALDIFPLQDRTDVIYRTLSGNKDFFDEQELLAKDLFNEWLKK